MKEITAKLRAGAERASELIARLRTAAYAAAKKILSSGGFSELLRWIGRHGVQVIGIVVLFFALSALILYDKGYYDITFIERETAGVAETEGDAAGSGEQTPVGEPEPDAPSDMPPSAEASVSYADFEGSLMDAATFYADGKSLYTAEYDDAVCVLAKVTPSETWENVFSFGNVERDLVTLEVGWYRGLERRLSTGESVRPALETYMGYVIRDNGASIDLLDSSGKLIYENIGKYKKAYAWDARGRAMFLSGSHYLAVGGDGRLYGASFDRDSDTCGLFSAQPKYVSGDDLDYTLYSDEAEVLLTVDENGTESDWMRIDIYSDATMPPEAAAKLRAIEKGETFIDSKEDECHYEKRTVTVWGYKDKYGNIAAVADWLKLYQYSDNGLAAAVGIDGRLRFIDKQGTVKIDVSEDIYYPAQFDNSAVIDGFYAAEFDLPSETTGMYYFSHGLVRVRRKYIDKYWTERVLSDYDILIDEKGEEFKLPGSFNLIAYSDGVALVEKNGKYGYYDYRGVWLVPPIYTYAEPFSQGLGVIGYEDGKKCMVATDGKVIMPMVYDYISSASEGVITAYSTEGGWSLYNLIG